MLICSKFALAAVLTSVEPASALSALHTVVPASPASPMQVASYGSTGANGALIVAAGQTRVIDLATEGTYDSTNWVVRFDYTSVDIGANATVRFTNHPSRAPVAWIVQGNVTIGQGALVSLDGGTGKTGVAPSVGYGEPGPGGFRGGQSSSAGFLDSSSAGFGPGGGKGNGTDALFGGTGASYRTSGQIGQDAAPASGAGSYGGPAVFHLVGGSGGGAGRSTNDSAPVAGGGGGGGAILIAADGEIDVFGVVRANGGSGGAGTHGNAACGGGGSGGSVRLSSLVLVRIGATGQVRTDFGAGGINGYFGGSGGFGRCRIECPGALPNIQGAIPDQTSIGEPQLAFRITPPRVRVASIGGVATPADSTITAGLGFAGEPSDMVLFQPGLVSVVVDCADLPMAGQLYLRITRAKGHADVLGPFNVGAGTSSVTIPNVDLSAGFSALQARVAFF